jgi:hypothetical protein
VDFQANWHVLLQTPVVLCESNERPSFRTAIDSGLCPFQHAADMAFADNQLLGAGILCLQGLLLDKVAYVDDGASANQSGLDEIPDLGYLME